ncbi:MAG TPA: HD domain-containing protein, partial [Candidatus Paceibacterota bacterium]|nr:HD domain-containing protein [Candidatus Paceibacterota bacterium]
MAPKDIVQLMKNPSEMDKLLIVRAFEFAQKAHAEQKRFSGEPYFTHPYEVAKILAGLNADAETIAAGLLHDTIEDGVATDEEIRSQFGVNVLFLVEGVTKLGKLKYQGVERHVESLRKFFVAMAADVRVIMIRLADRLHNVSTLEHVRPDKRKRIAI